MKRQRGTVTPLAKGRWRVQIMVAGERRSRNVRGTKTDAEDALTDLLAQAGVATDMTLKAFAAGPWKRSVQTLRAKTLDGYESKLNTHVLPFLNVRLPELDARRLQRWADERIAAGVSIPTLHGAFSVLRNVLRRALAWGYITADPTAGVKIPRRPDREVGSADETEAKAILELFRGEPIEAAVIMAIAAGLRLSETAALDWSDVDFHAGAVKVRRGYHETSLGPRMEPPKSKMSRRSVPLPASSLARLKALRGVGPLVSEDGARMLPTHISAAYRRRMKAKDSGVRWIPLRDCRHTYASLLLKRGVSPAIVAQLMGHSTISVTYTHYASRMELAGVAAVAELDAALGGNWG